MNRDQRFHIVVFYIFNRILWKTFYQQFLIPLCKKMGAWASFIFKQFCFSHYDALWKNEKGRVAMTGPNRRTYRFSPNSDPFLVSFTDQYYPYPRSIVSQIYFGNLKSRMNSLIEWQIIIKSFRGNISIKIRVLRKCSFFQSFF